MRNFFNSPAIVDDSCDFSVVAQRIAWSKFSTCGQVNDLLIFI